ncbi:universal stress protein [Mycolicibacterium sp.]|uniref:universal stress protein n=1 Tax=Mycolicibacterium sp. TaxID=2320850 RepID=UPI001A1CDF8C|nr:universal stress protein [Mycolicibacterium sp.]MBJ7338117.1 universal stress protein [Mycolicibacterium sp.]
MTSHSGDVGVVVGIDGSEPAKAALRWAAREAMLRHVPLSIVHAYTPAIIDGHDARLQARVTKWQRYQGRRIIDEAVGIVTELATGHNPTLETDTISSRPLSALVDASKEAQLVVVGSRGRGRLDRLVLGSVSTGLCHHAHCPVAVIHADPAVGSESRPVLLGVDGSPASDAATAIAFDAASRRGVGVLALHAWSDAGVYTLMGPDWHTFQHAADEVLAERLAGWQERYPDVHVERMLVCDEPAYWITTASDKAQLVVLGSHGRGGLASMLLGSVSTAVAQSATVPVIVTRCR